MESKRGNFAPFKKENQMIIQLKKPEYAIECDACGARNALTYEEHSHFSLENQLAEQADKLGFFRVSIDCKSVSRTQRGNIEITICAVCLRALCASLSNSEEKAMALWTEFAKFLPDELRKGLTPMFLVPPVTIEAKDAVKNVVTGTFGLPMSTATILQMTAADQGCYGPEEQAALQRLIAQEGTADDIELFRAVSKLAKINLPEVRSLESVHEELRRNA